MKDPINQRLGQAIRKARLKRGWSMEQLAGETSLSTNYIGNIERGEKSPTVRVLVRISNALKVKADLWVKALQTK